MFGHPWLAVATHTTLCEALETCGWLWPRIQTTANQRGDFGRHEFEKHERKVYYKFNRTQTQKEKCHFVNSNLKCLYDDIWRIYARKCQGAVNFLKTSLQASPRQRRMDVAAPGAVSCARAAIREVKSSIGLSANDIKNIQTPCCCLYKMAVSKNRGILPPTWMVKIMENPMNKWMIWEVFPTIFGNTHCYYDSIMSYSIQMRIFPTFRGENKTYLSCHHLD